MLSLQQDHKNSLFTHFQNLYTFKLPTNGNIGTNFNGLFQPVQGVKALVNINLDQQVNFSGQLRFPHGSRKYQEKKDNTVEDHIIKASTIVEVNNITSKNVQSVKDILKHSGIGMTVKYKTVSNEDNSQSNRYNNIKHTFRFYSTLYANTYKQSVVAKFFTMHNDKNSRYSGTAQCEFSIKDNQVNWNGSNFIYSQKLTPTTDGMIGYYIENYHVKAFQSFDHHFFNHTGTISLKTELDLEKSYFDTSVLSVSATGKLNNLFNIAGLFIRGQIELPDFQVNTGMGYQNSNIPLQCELVTRNGGEKIGVSISYEC